MKSEQVGYCCLVLFEFKILFFSSIRSCMKSSIRSGMKSEPRSLLQTTFGARTTVYLYSCYYYSYLTTTNSL